MPTFDYFCKACGEQFEVFLLPREKDSATISCTVCGASEVQKIISSPKVVYKSSGFYSSDTKDSQVQEKNTDNDSSACAGQCSCHNH